MNFRFNVSTCSILYIIDIIFYIIEGYLSSVIDF